MKTLSIFFSTLVLFVATAFAQAPQGISYQAIVRDPAGNALPDSTVSLRLTITDGSGGPIIYQETHDTTTNPFGLVTLTIGGGAAVSGTFNTINWGAITPWLQEEVDITGGSSYVSMGSYQLLSVPYALYAANAQNAVNATNAWSKDGNAGTDISSNFIGTSDSVDLVFKTNNSEAMRITADGKLKVGSYTLPAADGTASGQVLTTDAQGKVSWQDAATGNSNGWNLTGNIGTNAATHFIGTLDSVDLVFKTDSIERGRFTAAGSLVTVEDAVINGVMVGNGAGNSINADSSNTAIGANGVLNSNTTGTNNTATGYGALRLNLTGSSNTAMGVSTLISNTAGSNNTAVGFGAVSKNTDGSKNTAFGLNALTTNVTGSNNTAIGAGADVTKAGLTNATAIGYNAKVDTSNSLVLGGTGADRVNVGIGTTKPRSILHVNGAVRIGMDSFYILPAVRGKAGQILTQGPGGAVAWGSGIGWNLRGNTGTDMRNDFIGTTDSASLTLKVINQRSGWLDIIGQNTSFGIGALDSVTINVNNNRGVNNTAMGNSALINNTQGSNNSAFGKDALITNLTGTNNTAIGSGADVTADNLTNATAIGYNAKVGASNSLVLGGTGADSVNVGIGTIAPEGTLQITKDLVAFAGGDVGQLIITEATDPSWRLLAGTESSGGYSYLQAMRHGHTWDGKLVLQGSGGNVGIGTTEPVTKLEVEGQVRINGHDSQLLTGDGKYSIGGAKGWDHDKLYINGWGHYTDGVQIGSQIGNNRSDLSVYGNLHVNATVKFGMGTGEWISSNRYAGANQWGLDFFTRHTARLSIANNGNVGIGTQDPQYRLHVAGSGDPLIYCDNQGGDAAYFFSNKNTLFLKGPKIFWGLGNAWMSGSLTQGSDKRFKKNIADISTPLDKIMLLKPSTYDFKTEELPQYNFPSGRHFGFIAQDVQKVFPELVSENDGEWFDEKQNKKVTDGNKYLSVNYIEIVPIIVAAVQEQQHEIDELKRENTELKSRLEEIGRKPAIR